MRSHTESVLELIRQHKLMLEPALEEYTRLQEADAKLTELFGPIHKPKRKYTRRPKPTVELPEPKTTQELRLNVQTLTHNPREFDDREVVHVTQEGGQPDGRH